MRRTLTLTKRFFEEFVGLEKLPKRVSDISNDWKAVREQVKKQVAEELGGQQ
jgi:threonine synthase